MNAAEQGEEWGVAQQDITTITKWLAAHDFRVIGVEPNRMMIDFEGTAGAVREAFHTEIHNLEVKGRMHVANMSDPSIPSALAPVVAGIASLHNFPRKPFYHRVGTFARSKATGEVRPLFTFTPPGQSTLYALGPTDFATIYSVQAM
jgi:subtilase family serine protease